jgi:hypothetical protein
MRLQEEAAEAEAERRTPSAVVAAPISVAAAERISAVHLTSVVEG